MLSIFFTAIILILTPTAQAQQTDRGNSNRRIQPSHAWLVLGDNCESGQDFPVTIDGTLLVGCSTFSGERWYSRFEFVF